MPGIDTLPPTGEIVNSTQYGGTVAAPAGIAAHTISPAASTTIRSVRIAANVTFLR